MVKERKKYSLCQTPKYSKRTIKGLCSGPYRLVAQRTAKCPKKRIRCSSFSSCDSVFLFPRLQQIRLRNKDNLCRQVLGQISKVVLSGLLFWERLKSNNFLLHHTWVGGWGGGIFRKSMCIRYETQGCSDNNTMFLYVSFSLSEYPLTSERSMIFSRWSP